MHEAYVVTGTVQDARTVVLDEALPIQNGRVRVVVEVVELPPVEKKNISEAMERIQERQRQRGHVPPTREEVDAYIRAERDSWGDDE